MILGFTGCNFSRSFTALINHVLQDALKKHQLYWLHDILDSYQKLANTFHISSCLKIAWWAGVVLRMNGFQNILQCFISSNPQLLFKMQGFFSSVALARAAREGISNEEMSKNDIVSVHIYSPCQMCSIYKSKDYFFNCRKLQTCSGIRDLVRASLTFAELLAIKLHNQAAELTGSRFFGGTLLAGATGIGRHHHWVTYGWATVSDPPKKFQRDVELRGSLVWSSRIHLFLWSQLLLPHQPIGSCSWRSRRG